MNTDTTSDQVRAALRASDRLSKAAVAIIVLAVLGLSIRIFAPMPRSMLSVSLTGVMIFFSGVSLEQQVKYRRGLKAQPISWIRPTGIGAMCAGAIIFVLAVGAMLLPGAVP
jgi:uncharacterized transporter YbjL